MGRHERTDESDPFVVVGVTHGARRVVTAASPEAAFQAMLGFLRLDPEAEALWGLRRDWAGPVMAVCRWRTTIPGIRQSQCVAHVIQFVPGEQHGGDVTACCGKDLHLHALEWLNEGEGMPCPACVMRAAGGGGPPALESQYVDAPRVLPAAQAEWRQR